MSIENMQSSKVDPFGGMSPEDKAKFLELMKEDKITDMGEYFTKQSKGFAKARNELIRKMETTPSFIKEYQKNYPSLTTDDGFTFTRITVKGQGNCLFNSIVWLLFKRDNPHMSEKDFDGYAYDLRQLTAMFLDQFRDTETGRLKMTFKNYVETVLIQNPIYPFKDYDEYVKITATDGKWADEVHVAAIANMLNVEIVVVRIMGDPDTGKTSISRDLFTPATLTTSKMHIICDNLAHYDAAVAAIED